MAVSVAVCEIFSVKEWRDLENQVRGRSRSLKMVPFDRPDATFYWSAIVNIALSCTIFQFYWRRIISWPWNRGYRSLNVIETGAIRKLWCGFLFTYYSNCGRIYGIPFVRYSMSKNGVTLKTRLGVVQGYWKWRRSIDHMRLSIGRPL